eukprot:s629_g11.t1
MLNLRITISLALQPGFYPCSTHNLLIQRWEDGHIAASHPPRKRISDILDSVDFVVTDRSRAGLAFGGTRMGLVKPGSLIRGKP